MGVILDSSFVIDLLRNDRHARAKIEEIESRALATHFVAPVLYEVAAGLAYTRSRSEASRLRAALEGHDVLPFDESAAMRAADVRAELLRRGARKPEVDVMVAGIALAGGHIVVTRDRDFDALADSTGLAIERY
ncbi:MAG: type II toxin-antitoxin system VapC family toxin [Thermoplasmatota archaeon]